MHVTEELLEQLGFRRPEGLQVWDYTCVTPDGSPVVVRAGRHGQLGWAVRFDTDGAGPWQPVESASSLLYLIYARAFARGVTTTQDRLHAALGLDRLVEAAVAATVNRPREG